MNLITVVRAGIVAAIGMVIIITIIAGIIVIFIIIVMTLAWPLTPRAHLAPLLLPQVRRLAPGPVRGRLRRRRVLVSVWAQALLCRSRSEVRLHL